MPLETATFIDGLDASNPVGSTDKVQTLDDHLRLVKSTIKATFPNIAGEVTPTHTELNYVDGVTSAIQTQLNAITTGYTAADVLTKIKTVDGASSGLDADLLDGQHGAYYTGYADSVVSSYNASIASVLGLASSALQPAGNGSALTALNGTNIASGTVADARLSSNVPLKNATNTFTAAQTINVANDVAGLVLNGVTAGALSIYPYLVSVGGSYIATPNNMYFQGSALTLNFSGIATGAATVTTSNSSASEVGYKGVPLATARHT